MMNLPADWHHTADTTQISGNWGQETHQQQPLFTTGVTEENKMEIVTLTQ